MAGNSLSISIVGIGVRIHCDNPEVLAALTVNFDAMAASVDACDLEYRVHAVGASGEINIARLGSDFNATAKNLGELIYLLEGNLVVNLQLQRPDLMFLHAAVVGDNDTREAHIFTGPSGAGKSTLCWGLLNHGFRYLSDELAPVDLRNTSVAPYLHGLCLKAAPAHGYPLPHATLQSERGFHVPPSSMPAPFVPFDLPLRSVFFVEYLRGAVEPSIDEVGKAEAATRIYPNVLNALAHDNDGLEGALRLVRKLRCYRLTSGDLTKTCALVKDHLAITTTER